MTIPVYVVTGFLDAGKTTFLNHLLNRKKWQEERTLLIQFETGEGDFHSLFGNCRAIVYSKKDLEQGIEKIPLQLVEHLQFGEYDMVWVEWNGVAPFSQLQAIFLHPALRGLCKLRKVVHVADASAIEMLLGRTGSSLPEQIANSDLILLRNANSSHDTARIRQLMHGINPGVRLYKANAYRHIYQQIPGRRNYPAVFFLMALMVLLGLHWMADPLQELFSFSINKLINVFSGILLQAIPFLLIGVLLSSAIQVFVPRTWIEQRFPKSLALGMLTAIVGGFCLPVCDCASIPIFRSLIKKGIPLPVAVTFMTATPVINPVVILSTYYAFSGNLTIVIGRIVLGILASVLIGLFFAIRPPKKDISTGGALDRITCSCGCYESAESLTKFPDKFGLFIRHSQAEFFNVGKYLVIGTFTAAVFQVAGMGLFTKLQSGAGLALSILVMMAMAFVLSLCSSSDAVIARSFSSQFPLGAIMGFLVFGPMMDIKNILMLSSSFSKRFVINLLFVSFAVCFLLVFLFFGLGGL